MSSDLSWLAQPFEAPLLAAIRANTKAVSLGIAYGADY